MKNISLLKQEKGSTVIVLTAHPTANSLNAGALPLMFNWFAFV